MDTYLRTMYKLWNNCESLHFNRIELKRLPLILAMPFAVVIADMQYSLLGLQDKILGLDFSIVLQIACSIGALSIFLLGNRHVFTFIRVSMAVSAAFLILCFILHISEIKVFSAVAGFFGLGGCAISATLFYCASLQNTERLYGVMLLAALSPIFILIKNAGISSTVIDIIIPITFIAAMLYCLYRIKREDLEQLQIPNQACNNGSIILLVVFLLRFFNTKFF